MASTQVIMWLSVFAVSQLMTLIAQPESRSLIRRGSSLQPNNNSSYWLSPSGRFAFGFYPEGSEFAVGIWLVSTNPHNITVVYSGRPISLLKFYNSIHKGWTAHSSNKHSEVIWESFSLPTDTLLDGQSLPRVTPLTSSLSTSDHSRGQFQIQITGWGELVSYPANHTDAIEEFCWRVQDTYGIYGLNLTDGILQATKGNGIATIVNVTYNAVRNESVIHGATLDAHGIFRLYLHRFKTDGSSDMIIHWSALQNQCKVKGFFASQHLSCCFCFPGFDFINQRDRYLGCSRSFIDRQGCKRKEPSPFYNVDVLENTRLGGLPYALLSLNKEACSKSCLEDCYCGDAFYVDGTCRKLKLPLMFSMKDENESGTMFIKSLRNVNDSFSGRSSPIVPKHEREIK